MMMMTSRRVCGCSTGREWIVDVLSTHPPTTDTVTPAYKMSDESSLLHQVEDNFTSAGRLYAADVGGLCWVESLQMHVAFFLFNDVTDPHREARHRLPGGPQIHRCDTDGVCFTQTHFGRAYSTAFEREREFWNLCSFLRSVSYGPVYVFPSEELLCVDSAISVCDRVRRHLLTSRSCARSTAHSHKAAASLVFVRRANSSFVIHSGLLHRVLNYAQSELLSARRSVYVVVDVGLSVGLSTFQGLLEPSSSSIHMAVYSGAKPLFSPISCVVIALHSGLPAVIECP